MKETHSEDYDNVSTMPYGIGRVGAGDATSVANTIVGLCPTADDASCYNYDPNNDLPRDGGSRTVQAVNYRHRGGATKLDFAGTDLMPAATGEAKVESKKGYIEIEVEFAKQARPTTFGNEYLTYVMWAISPEGRAVNLGEVLVGDNDRSKLDVTTDLQAFALIVTAEPYYAVRQPSNVGLRCGRS